MSRFKRAQAATGPEFIAHTGVGLMNDILQWLHDSFHYILIVTVVVSI